MALDLCSVQGGNTGSVNCDTSRGRPVLPIVGGKQFSSSDYVDAATLQAALLAATKLGNGDANKLVAFPEIQKVDINTQASTSGNLPFGPSVQLVKGIPAYTYTVNVTWSQYKKLLAYHKKVVPVFTLDDANNLWGYRAAAAANTLNTNAFRGEYAYITIEGLGFKDGTNVESGLCKIGVAYQSVDDFEKRGDYANLPDLSSGDVKGLKDVVLSENSAHVSNVYKVKASIPLSKLAGDLNIYDEYGAILAAQVANWSAGTGANYATSMPITSIAVDAPNKCLTVTLDTTAFGLLSAAAKIKLNPPTVAQLDAAGATGIEIGYIILTK